MLKHLIKTDGESVLTLCFYTMKMKLIGSNNKEGEKKPPSIHPIACLKGIPTPIG